MKDNDRARRLQAVAEECGWREDVGVLELDDERMEREATVPQVAGAGVPVEPVPAAFDCAQREAAGVAPDAIPYGRPRWAIELAQREVPDEQMLQALIEHVTEAPSEKLYRQAELMLADFERSEKGRDMVRESVSDELVAKLTRERN